MDFSFIMETKINSIVHPFLPEILKKEFIKRKNKKKSDIEIKIENN